MENIRTEKDRWATKTGLDYAPCETRKRKILEWVKPEQKQSQSKSSNVSAWAVWDRLQRKRTPKMQGRNERKPDSRSVLLNKGLSVWETN